MISVLVADDHGIVREGLARLLGAEPEIRVCASAADGREVLEQTARERPDIVILDISMPVMGGLETLERLRAAHPEVKAILLSVHGEPSFIQSAVALGAEGYVLKNGPVSELLEAIRSVMRGGRYFSPPVAREIVDQLRAPGRAQGPFAALSSRERQVLQLIAEGLSAKEVAARLSISAKTVEAHRTSMMRKLGLRKATELVRYALRHGLIQP